MEGNNNTFAPFAVLFLGKTATYIRRPNVLQT